MIKKFSQLQAGMRITHNGRAMELLYLSDTTVQAEVWRVQPLFVDELPRDETFKKGEHVKMLHVRRVGAA